MKAVPNVRGVIFNLETLKAGRTPEFLVVREADDPERKLPGGKPKSDESLDDAAWREIVQEELEFTAGALAGFVLHRAASLPMGDTGVNRTVYTSWVADQNQVKARESGESDRVDEIQWVGMGSVPPEWHNANHMNTAAAPALVVARVILATGQFQLTSSATYTN